MSDSQNPWQPELTEQAKNAVPTVSAPPTEVSIRTMASDLSSLGETGGGPPRAMNVAVPSLSRFETPVSEAPAQEPETAAPTAVPETPVQPGSSSHVLLWAVAALFGVAVLFLGGYYLLPLLSKPKTVQQPSPPVRATSTVPSNQPPVPPKATFEHHSVFKQPVDWAVALNLASSAEGFRAYGGQANELLKGASSTLVFFEAAIQDPGGNPLSASAFLESFGANVFAGDLLKQNFNADFTLFFYRDKNGLWPGFVFELLPGRSPILLQQEVKKIEDAANISNLFLKDSGTPEGAFKDALVSGQPVRVVNFSDKKSVLAYGWFFNKYLIVSTSLEGIKQAITRF